MGRTLTYSCLFPVSYTGPYPELVPEPPPVSLLSLRPILSVILQLVIIMGFQVLAWFLVMAQPW